MSEYSLYVVGRRSYLHNSIQVVGVFPIESDATHFRSVFAPGLDVFKVCKVQFQLGDCGIEIPFNVKVLK